MTDFFEVTQENIRNLNQTERKLFDYVVKNMHEAKQLSIQKFATKQFLSTTTIFRFTQKLGFSGYSDFINSLLVTAHQQQDVVPAMIKTEDFRKNYLENALESVRVLSPNHTKEVISLLHKKPRIYILTDDHTHTIGQYCERLFIGLGFHAYFPETAYQRQNLANRIRRQDMIIALSHQGKDAFLIDFIQRVFLRAKPHLISITRADNNPLENLSDHNFYVFTDEINTPHMNLTSSVPMLMTIELLVYEYLTNSEELKE